LKIDVREAEGSIKENIFEKPSHLLILLL
jgi:hypothetical protein